MTRPILCQIRVRGHLSDEWTEWFGGLTIENQSQGQAELCGPLPDQTALFSVLDRIRDLGLVLIWLNCSETIDRPKDYRR